jgi:hypothetical protein
MVDMSIREGPMRGVIAASVALFAVAPAHGATISWTRWKADTVGAAGTAKGEIVLPSGKVHVRYRGEVESESVMGHGAPNWQPSSTWSGGTVGNPPPRGNQISFYGGPDSGTNSITFSQPVTNPIIAIYSLGAGTLKASLAFKQISLSFESGGPSQQHGGSAITVKKRMILGEEGNGTVQVNGTVTRITFTAPVHEVYCSVTVGLPE